MCYQKYLVIEKIKIQSYNLMSSKTINFKNYVCKDFYDYILCINNQVAEINELVVYPEEGGGYNPPEMFWNKKKITNN